MDQAGITNYRNTPDITSSEYKKLSGLLQEATGIKLPASKMIMVTSRLNKRLKALGMNNFSSYYNYLQTLKGQETELEHAINAISTNKTGFFREDSQFTFLAEKVLPLYLDKDNKTFKEIKIWSAGCSTGQEPYTLGMIMENLTADLAHVYYSILATDISSHVLNNAGMARYSEKEITGIPVQYKKRYLLKGKNNYNRLYHITREIIKNVTFKKHNLMVESFHEIGMMDIIFCRNVIIYFDRETQAQLIKKFYQVLCAGGFLFIGASEILFNIAGRFQFAGPNIYQKKAGKQ